MAVWSPLGAPVQQAALGAWKLHRSFSSSCRITLTTDGSHADWQRACGKSLWLTLPLLDLSSLCFTPSISPPLPLSSLLSSSAPGFPAGLEGSGDVSCDLSPVEQLGMRTTLRYGKFLKLLKDDAEVDIALLLRRCKDFLSQQRVKTDSETLYSLQGCSLPPHDWLCSSVFLMAAGDGSLALALLLRLSRLLVSAFLWPRRLHASVHLPVELAQSGIPAVYWCTAHYVELLLKAEVPLVGSAFRMSGFTPSQMCVQWLGQCFWNYLDWPEICHYVCTCVVLGPDYQVYMCIAVLKHLQPDILLHAQTQDLQVFLKEEPISGFKVCNYLEFMEGLERRYRAMVLTDMKSILHASG